MRWIAVVATTAVLSAASPRAAPTILLTPTSLSFSAPATGPNPPPKTVIVKNNGNGRMDWRVPPVGGKPDWVTVTPPNGSLRNEEEEPIQVAVNVSGLSAGTHNGTIVIEAPGATNPGGDETIGVTVVVSAAPAIGLSTASLTFNAPFGGPNPAAQNVTVTNVGGGSLTWSANDAGVPWLTQTPPGGGPLGPGASNGMSVGVDVTGLAASPPPHTATITVSGGAGVTSKTIAVTLNVSALPVITLTPNALTFNVPFGHPTPISQTVQVRNDGGTPLTWTVADASNPWLAESPPGGGTLAPGAQQTMTVTVTPNDPALTEGVHTGTVTVSGGMGVTAKTVSVTVNVNSAPRIGLNPSSLSFATARGTGPTAAQALSITNSGGATLTWSASADQPWVLFSPPGGSLGAVTSEPLSVTLDPSGLAEGVHTASLLISATGASNTPQLVAVSLDLGPPPEVVPAEHVSAGQCGALGLEGLLLLALIRRRRKGSRS